MKSIKPILTLLLLGGIAFAIWYFFFPPPEKVIRQRLEKLASAISARPSGNIAIIANVNTIGSFFHPQVQISLQGFGRDIESIQSRGEVQQMAMGARQRIGAIDVKFYNIDVLVDDTRTEAEVFVTALVNLNDQADAIVQNLRMQMVLLDKKWVIRSVTPVQEQLIAR